jgi:hypothetical protein
MRDQINRLASRDIDLLSPYISGDINRDINTIWNLLFAGSSRNDILFVNLEDPRFVNDLNLKLLSLIKEIYLERL